MKWGENGRGRRRKRRMLEVGCIFMYADGIRLPGTGRGGIGVGEEEGEGEEGPVNLGYQCIWYLVEYYEV